MWIKNFAPDLVFQCGIFFLEMTKNKCLSWIDFQFKRCLHCLLAWRIYLMYAWGHLLKTLCVFYICMVYKLKINIEFQTGHNNCLTNASLVVVRVSVNKQCLMPNIPNLFYIICILKTIWKNFSIASKDASMIFTIHLHVV